MTQTLNFQPGDRLLVSRTDRLGDLILALPFVESLKARYPDCQIHVMASLYASPILENNPRIDGIVRVQHDQLIGSRNYRKELEQKISKNDYRAAVLLYPERHISRLLHRINLPIRIGTAGRFHSVYYTHRLMHSRKANRKHESAYNLDFLRYFRPGPTVVRPEVIPTRKEQDYADQVLLKSGIEKPFVAMHPGSGGSAERWPMLRFLELYQRLEADGKRVVITGSLEEGKTIRALAAGAGIRITDIAGRTDLRTLAAVLSRASALVANSTGPLHLAVAVGTKVVGLYPSRKIMSPVRWGPLGEGHRVLQPDTNDCTCPEGRCRCMETITVDQAAEAVEAVFHNDSGE
jgi:lipopolysaccharide heptosyltransferase II